MHKLLNLMLLVTLIVTACFVTGCGNTDDDWKNPVSNEPVLTFTLGIKETMASSRAAIFMPETITISGVTFKKSSVANSVTYYSGNLTKSNLEGIYRIGYALMNFNNSEHTIASSFFREAYNEKLTQPQALLVLATDFSTVITAQANGKDVAKPQVSPYTPVSDPVLAFTLGIKQETIASSRAAIFMPETITISGVTFKKSSVANSVTYYSGNLTKSNLEGIYRIGYALMNFNNSEHTIASSFFREAYNGTQPTALLVLDTGFTTVITAQANGKDVAKPIVKPFEIPSGDTKVKVALSSDQETVTITVPSSVGVVSEYTAWTIVFYDNTVNKNITFTKGEYDKYYDEVPSNGNTLRLFITSAGKELMTKGHKYTGVLATLKVKLTDGTTKDLDVSQCVIDNVIWNQ